MEWITLTAGDSVSWLDCLSRRKNEVASSSWSLPTSVSRKCSDTPIWTPYSGCTGTQRVAADSVASVLSALEPSAGGARVRRVRGGAVRAFLRRGDGAAVVDAGAVFSPAADWLCRGDRGRARHRVASVGLAGAAPFSRTEAERGAAGSLHDLAHAAAD